MLTGTWGILVQPQFFDEQVRELASGPPEAFFVDDVWFCGHLAHRRVPRLIVPCRLPPLSTGLAGINGLFREVNLDGHNNNVVIRAFGSHWHSAGGPVGLLADRPGRAA